MSSLKGKPPTYVEVIAEVLRTATGPVPVAALIKRMLAARPSAAKSPTQLMRQHLREVAGQMLVFVDPDHVLPLRLAFQGVRYRLPLDRDSIELGRVSIGESLHHYLPPGFPPERVRFVDAAGQPIAFQVQPLSEQVETPYARGALKTWYAVLRDWLRAEKMETGDHLLVTIADWEHAVVQLEREPFSQHDPAQRAARNRLLADIFYDILEKAQGEQIFAYLAIPSAYIRLPDKGGYPPDDWMAVLAADERLYAYDAQIRYRDSQRTLRDLFHDVQPAAPVKPIPKDQGAQVYRFKAALAFRPGLWRTVEIQGKHTLADLDQTLRTAFNHDPLDHLGGFWKLLPRGTAKRSRFRDVHLGDVDPFEGGSGAGISIASLQLEIGDQLKYVYDFGDWIEHRLTLQAITPPEPQVKYPREVARNRPRYADCDECQARGRQRVAALLCVDCSDREGGRFVCVRRAHRTTTSITISRRFCIEPGVTILHRAETFLTLCQAVPVQKRSLGIPQK